jgi:tetratricopeptide (TPR) repeat protein
MALALNPDAIWAHWGLSLVLLAQGDAAAALAEIEHEPHDLFRLTYTPVAQHAVGDTEAADAALQALLERYPGEHYLIAQVYAFRGEIDQAFERLEQLKENPRSKELGQSWIYTLHIDPLFSNLPDDPRWEPFLDKIGLPH